TRRARPQQPQFIQVNYRLLSPPLIIKNLVFIFLNSSARAHRGLALLFYNSNPTIEMYI
ncbi:hypothetical protein FRC20_007102, partial [Serendipita sp. 405]